jgi:hypothetical protein
MADSLVYIPDISGFTDFVNNTEINHAQHIISELLELIIDANEIGMEVAEIEGDAVLFYKHNDVPSAEEIITQSEKIFIEFHNHLVRYESERLCQCGACSNASELTLKIIAHTGEIGFTKVKDHSKPFGSTLVEAHRLLKNQIEDNEYLLMTEHYKKSMSNSTHVTVSSPWIALHKGESNLEHRKVEYVFIPLSPLHSKVELPAPSLPPPKISNPVTEHTRIDKPIHFVYEMVSNLDFRLSWNKGINELIYENGKTNRVGTKHRCLFNKGFADFETITNDFGKDQVVYGEKLDSIPVAKDMSIYYIMKEIGNSTELRIEFHYHPKPFWGWILVPLIRANLKKNIKKAASAIKEVSESTEDFAYQAV